MSAFLAPVFAIGAQLFDNQGRVLTGGKLYTYYAGSTTAQATWTSSIQTVQNANPIILDSAGRITNEIWLAGGSTYKFVLADSADSPLGTYDNVPGVNDANYNAFSEWVTFGSSPTYVSASQFTVSGNQVAIFQVGRRVQFYLGGGTYYGSVAVSSYATGTTTVTINPDSTGLDATLFALAYGFMSAVNSSLPVNIYAPLISPTFTGNVAMSGATSVTVPTATAGDSSTKAASTAFVQATAFSAALPNQAGHAGQFVTTNGSTASWGPAGISAVQTQTSATDITLTASSSGFQKIIMTAPGKSVSLPDATTMANVGGPWFIVDNDGGYPLGIRDSAGTLLMGVAAGGIAYIALEDKSTPAGEWNVSGTNLEPGLITIDQTFSSTYASTVLKPFVALDSNKSIHFLALASGFAAVCVDKTTGAVGTPVTVDATASSVPRTAFMIDSTHAMVFYGPATSTLYAVVITLSGSTTLAVGTAANSGANTGIAIEDFVGAPKIAQLQASLYLVSLSTATGAGNTSVMGCYNNAGTPVFGSKADIIAVNNVIDSTTTYALTTLTALVTYGASSTAHYANVISVTNANPPMCSVGAQSGGTNLGAVPVFPIISCKLSATKVLFAHSSGGTAASVQVLTISGTSVADGTSATVETTTLAQAGFAYTGNSATRYNPHLWAIGSNTAGLWYLDGSGISRCAVITESGGVVTAGAVTYKNISWAAANSAGYGVILPQGTADFCSINETVANTAGWGLQLLSNKISGTTITSGATKPLRNIAQQSPATIAATKLSSGDYIVVSGDNGAALASDCIPVFRTNGDAINYRGEVTCPAASFSGGAYPVQAVAANRVVLLGAQSYGSSVGATTYQLRLVNLEIAA